MAAATPPAMKSFAKETGSKDMSLLPAFFGGTVAEGPSGEGLLVLLDIAFCSGTAIFEIRNREVDGTTLLCVRLLFASQVPVVFNKSLRHGFVDVAVDF